MFISLKPKERIYLNGAVVRVDRRVKLELLNDVTFLLESHVLQLEDTHTPVRQLYFVGQAMLMDPDNAVVSRDLFDRMADDLLSATRDPVIARAVSTARAQLVADRCFDALKSLRAVFAHEAAVLADGALGGCPPVPVAGPASSMPVLSGASGNGRTARHGHREVALDGDPAGTGA